MIHYRKGNIFDTEAEALVNTVNLVGVMGKGIALQFKKIFPNNFKIYKKACQEGHIDIGKVLVVKDTNLNIGEKFIVNFPTKRHWKNSSEYEYIEAGLDSLVASVHQFNIESIAIPPLGAGNGGLQWKRVKELIEDRLADIDIDIYLYEPTSEIKEHLKEERVKLTKARSLLLYMLFELVKEGEYVSEFSSEKVCYFLQRFGAKKYFKLTYEPKFYGPYSGKVRYLLNVLNGSYIRGYSDMNKKPFEPLTLIQDSYDEVQKTVMSDNALRKIATDTTTFLNGFYSDFSLELLSSVDFITKNEDEINRGFVIKQLESWSGRKTSMFTNPKYLTIAIAHIADHRSKMVKELVS